MNMKETEIIDFLSSLETKLVNSKSGTIIFDDRVDSMSNVVSAKFLLSVLKALRENLVPSYDPSGLISKYEIKFDGVSYNDWRDIMDWLDN